MSLFLKITARSDWNSSSISVWCFCWTPLVLSPRGERSSEGEWEEGRECVVLFCILLPFKKRRVKRRKRGAARAISVIPANYPQSFKPLNRVSSSSGTGRQRSSVGRLVVPASLAHPSQQWALMTGSKLIPFVSENSPWLETLDLQLSSRRVIWLRWRSRIISLFIVVLFVPSSWRRRAMNHRNVSRLLILLKLTRCSLLSPTPQHTPSPVHMQLMFKGTPV